MRIVFTKDIPKIAKKNDIKDVADGYGRFLVSNGSAVLATGEIVQKVAIDIKKQKDLKAKTVSEFKDMVFKLRTHVYTIESKVSSGKHLFSGIRAEDITSQIEKQSGIVVNSKMLKLEKVIKETGEYAVAIEQGTMHGEIVVNIVASKQI